MLHHSVDSAKRTITLRCAVHNRTLEVIKGVEVRAVHAVHAVLCWDASALINRLTRGVCFRTTPANPPAANTALLSAAQPLRCTEPPQVELTLGGPVAPGHRRPLTFKLEPLPPAGSTSWETELRVSGFGWPTVQPTLHLPIKVGAVAGLVDSGPMQGERLHRAGVGTAASPNLKSQHAAWTGRWPRAMRGPLPTNCILPHCPALQLPGGEEATMQCRPYNISPLQVGCGGLLAGSLAGELAAF